MPHLFDPITLRDVTFANRLWLSPMCMYSCEGRDGAVGEFHRVHLASRAAGGFGLLLTEATAVTSEGRIAPEDAGIWNEAQRRAWTPVVESVHEAGGQIAIQLAHAGRKASTFRPWEPAGMPVRSGSVPQEEGGWETVSASSLPFPGFAAPRELTEREVGDVVRAFRDAAVRAVDAGFDAVEIHAAHGYLLHQFLSPLTNAREDRYGGDPERRARFAVEVVEAVRGAIGLPILVRISATDWLEGGLVVEDFEQVCRWLRRAGADIVDVSSGAILPAPIPIGPAYQAHLAAHLRSAVGIPVGAVGMIDDAALAERLVAEGESDVVLVGRAALRDPYLPLHWALELGGEAAIPPQYLRGAWRQ